MGVILQPVFYEKTLVTGESKHGNLTQYDLDKDFANRSYIDIDQISLLTVRLVMLQTRDSSSFEMKIQQYNELKLIYAIGFVLLIAFLCILFALIFGNLYLFLKKKLNPEKSKSKAKRERRDKMLAEHNKRRED